MNFDQVDKTLKTQTCKYKMSSWVDLLSQSGSRGDPSELNSHKKSCVKVMDYTPVRKSKRLNTGCEFVAAESEEKMQVGKQIYTKVQQQAELITRLMADNTALLTHGKEQDIQTLRNYVHSLCNEFKSLSSNFQSPSCETSGLLEDLERSTYKNAELCESLAATQLSRNALEREVILLKRTLLEERSNTNLPHNAELQKQNEENLQLLEKKCTEIDKLKSLTFSQASQIKELNLQIENMRQSQLLEIDQRCSEVDLLKQQLSSQLSSLQQNCNSLACQLKDAKAENLSCTEELEAAKKHLSTQLSEECSKHEQLRNTYSELNKQLEILKVKVSDRSFELESAKSQNLKLNKQISDLREEVEVLQDQLSKSSAIHAELKHLLEQKTHRVQSLEKTLRKQNRDVSTCSLDLTSGSANSLLEQSSNIHGSLASEHHPFLQTDVLSLKQRLADSRQIGVRLEVQLAQLKTDNAKLSGSYQAMLSIRDRLSQENSKFRCSNRDLLLDRETWLNEREMLLSKLDAMSSGSQMLTSELAMLKKELQQVSYLYSSKDQQCIQTIHRLKEDHDKALSRVSDCHNKLDELNGLVENEGKLLESLMNDCGDALLNSRHELSDVKESVRICGSVNSTRRCQIEVCDENVIRLQGELESLRAQRAVLFCFYERSSVTEPSSELSITASLHSAKIAKLKHKLKTQKRQTNFVRIKLGYSLSELKLHKQLKIAYDKQLAELRLCLDDMQERYQLCAAQLQAAEKQLHCQLLSEGHLGT